MRAPLLCAALLSSLSAAATAADSVIVFNELHYHPPASYQAGEWIELHNQMAIDIDLSDWQLTEAIRFRFPEGTIIPAGGYLVIAANPDAVRSATGLATVLGPFSGNLANSGERVELRDLNDRLMDRLDYRDGGDWPVDPDGSGAALAKRDPGTPSDDPALWTSSIVSGGTPGARNFPDTKVISKSLIPLNALWRYDASGTDRGSAWKEPEFDETGWAGLNSASLVGYWPLNGNATATRGSNGVPTGLPTAATDRTGKAGAAVAFSGNTQFFSVPGGGGLNAAAAGTISLWARWNAVTQDADCCGTFGAITSRQANGAFSDTILALNSSNPATARLVWRQSGGPAPILLTSSAAVGSAWRHIAVTFGPDGSTLYLDGVAQGSANGAPMNSNPATPFTIGAWGGDGTGYMNGALDDVAIWDRPLSAAQIAALAAGNRSPMDFANPESAVYFSGDGRLMANDELRITELPSTPVTTYFRRSFQLEDPKARTSLLLDLAADDAAAIYLNGTEIHRHNLPDGPLSFSTLASSPVADTPLLTRIPLPSAALRQGQNTLAVEVHQASPNDSGMVFGAGLTAIIGPDGPQSLPTSSLVINEIAPPGSPWLAELVNRSASPIDAAGYILQRSGAGPDQSWKIPAQSIPPSGFLVVTADQTGFPLAPGDRLFLLHPNADAVADAATAAATGTARFPDGSGPFLNPSTPTRGIPNHVSLSQAIVISEILYHAPPTLETPASGGQPAIPFQRSNEQWIELHNRSSEPVSLAGWRFTSGIDFTFPANASIPAGGYLVVASNPSALASQFPGLNPLGPFSGTLSRSGERITLSDAAGNPADSVHYYDDGSWPETADAGGSSLELRDPRADNDIGSSWAASDESARSSWQTYTYSGIAAASQIGPDTQWREFVIGLLDKGEVLLDDISVTESPAGTPVAMLQNGTFTTDASKWRIIGNHSGTVIDDPDQPGNKVLRLVATGSTDHMSNHAETTFAASRSVVNGRTYQVSFRAKWISGCRQLNTRLYFNRLARTTILTGRSPIGTPGSPNSTATANAGPTLTGLSHSPAVPAPFSPVTVSITATDPDGIGSLILWSRPDGGSWSSQPLTASSSQPHAFTATLPGAAAGTVVQFYVAAADSRGATTNFPAAGPDSRALYEVNDGLAATNGLHNLRLVTLKADADWMHTTINLMSNQRVGASLVYNESVSFYDIGLRLKGSEHSRTTSARLGFNLGFPTEQLFRGIHRSLAIDRSESTGFGQREMLAHQMLNHAGGVPTKYHDLCHVIAPRSEHTGAAELQLARYTDVFLDDQYENGGDGMLFEYELVYQLNATDNGTAEGNKLPAPDSVVGTTIRNMGDDREQYRWTFLIKNNEDRDDYSRIIPWAKWMATTGTTFTNQINTYLDVNQWLRGHAVNVLTGAGDSYGGDGAQHNVQFFARPSDGRILYFPHDMDAFYDANRSIYPNADLNKILAVPAHARTYFGHLLEILDTTYNTAYMTRWANHFGKLLPAQPFSSHLAFIGQRATIVRNAVNSAVSPNIPFSISSNGGADFDVTTSTATLAGTANLAIRSILVNGIAYPVTWTTRSAWSITFPLQTGSNAITIQGIDRSGNPITTATDSITITTTAPPGNLPIRINEWMADNPSPNGYPDPADGQSQDWIELHNPNATDTDISGFTLTDDLTQPAAWAFPQGTTIPAKGFLLIWADGEPSQNTPGNGLHTPFQLSSAGETIALFNAAGLLQHAVTFGPQSRGISEGLFPDGATATPTPMPNPTPRWPNTLAGPLRITAISRSPSATSLSWSSLPGRSYRVDFTDGSSPWQTLFPSIPAASDFTTTSDPTADPRRFYRVQRIE